MGGAKAGYARLNLSIAAGFAASLAASTAVAQSLAGSEPHVNTTLTLAADYASYFGAFSLAFFLQNRARLSSAGPGAARKEIIRIISSLGIAEVIYSAIRWSLQYYLLTASHEPYLASIASQLVSTAAYLAAVNAAAWASGLYGAKRHG